MGKNRRTTDNTLPTMTEDTNGNVFEYVKAPPQTINGETLGGYTYQNGDYVPQDNFQPLYVDTIVNLRDYEIFQNNTNNRAWNNTYEYSENELNDVLLNTEIPHQTYNPSLKEYENANIKPFKEQDIKTIKQKLLNDGVLIKQGDIYVSNINGIGNLPTKKFVEPQHHGFNDIEL